MCQFHFFPPTCISILSVPQLNYKDILESIPITEAFDIGSSAVSSPHPPHSFHTPSSILLNVLIYSIYRVEDNF